MRSLSPVLCLLLAPAVACNPCTVKDTLEPGTVTGRINGDRWQTAEGLWFEAGTSLQINTSSTGGWALSIVIQKSDDGVLATDALDAEEFPIEFTLAESGAGGWALAYPEEGSPESSAEAEEPGFLTISNRVEDDIFGCFEFNAGTGETAVTLTNGSFRVPLRS